MAAMVASTPNSFDKPETQHDQAMLFTQFYLPLLPRVYTQSLKLLQSILLPRLPLLLALELTPHCRASPPLETWAPG